MEDKHDEIVIYQSEDRLIKVDVLFENREANGQKNTQMFADRVANIPSNVR